MCGIFGIIGEEYILNNLSQIQDALSLIVHRGPDSTAMEVIGNDNVLFGFHRLAIMDPSNNGNQPLNLNGYNLICNGEIYNYKKIIEEEGFEVKTGSDCEVILHLYKKYGIDATIRRLDGVFAFALYDSHKKLLYLGRDPIGVRPLFYVISDGNIGFCSEIKSLQSLYNNEEIKIFQPGTYMEIDENKNAEITRYYDYDYSKIINNTEEEVMKNIKILFAKSVNKRLMSDRPLGCLVSGGLDSSLVASIASHLGNDKLETFSIGIADSPDLRYADKVSNYLGTKHHKIEMDIEDFINVVPDVIRSIESYDITTVRASVPNYLLAQYINRETNIKVILSGEGADEILGGYLYFHNAPDRESFQNETERRVKLLHQYDVLRSDRATAAHGLEVRVPFLDKEFINYILSLDSKYKVNYDEYGMRIEKYILRKSFEGNYLPDDILWRQKDAFSDAVGYNWVTSIKEHANNEISDEEFANRDELYPHNTPDTKEAYYYRKIFEEYYPGRANLISEIWRPLWSDTNEPSATQLNIHKKM